jgi:hypothetical protein
MQFFACNQKGGNPLSVFSDPDFGHITEAYQQKYPSKNFRGFQLDPKKLLHFKIFSSLIRALENQSVSPR